MTPRTSTYLRRLALATLLAGAATFSGSAFGDLAVACAAPRELDVGAYDNCTARVDDAWARGDISDANHMDAYRECCEKAGGNWNLGTNVCVSPPAEQAQEAERQPAPQDDGLILWPGYTQIPASPAAPPPSEAAPAP